MQTQTFERGGGAEVRSWGDRLLTLCSLVQAVLAVVAMVAMK